MKDLYSVLGLTSQASQQDIKKAYRELAKKYHPDVVDNTYENNLYYNDIKEAYEILTNSHLRQQYLEARWYHKSNGAQPEMYNRKTAFGVLKELIYIEKECSLLDVNKNDIVFWVGKLERCVQDENLALINEKNEPALNQAIFNILLKIIPYLPIEHLTILSEASMKLPFSEKEKATVKQLILKKKRNQKLKQYDWLWVGLLVIVLMLFIYYWASA